MADLNTRTTSLVEGLNTVIQGTFADRTNIFNFIDSLKLYEFTKCSDLYNLTLGNNKSTQKKAEDVKRDQKIKFLTTKLKNGEISVASFLQSMSAIDLSHQTGTSKKPHPTGTSKAIYFVRPFTNMILL